MRKMEKKTEIERGKERIQTMAKEFGCWHVLIKTTKTNTHILKV